MLKRFRASFAFILSLWLLASCAVAKRPNWYYYRGGFYTYKTSPIYNRYGHWKGGGRNYTFENTYKSYSRAVRCPR